MNQDMEKLCKFALEQGATGASYLEVERVVMDERVPLKCQIPVCASYGSSLMCPPNVPTVEVMSQILKKYNHAIVVQHESKLESSTAGKPIAEIFGDEDSIKEFKDQLRPYRLKLYDLVGRVEAEAFKLGYRFSTGFGAGSCPYCAACNGKKCTHPFKARPSMEAVGMDVLETAKNAGLPIKFPADPDRVVWVGLILVG